MGIILKAENLTKKYYKKTALDNLNIEIESGKILGLLGPNGSGKTTFMKIAAGIMSSSKGKILIDGHAPDIYTKSIVSYLPDKDYLFNWMNIKDCINYFNDFYKDFNKDKAYSLLEFMNIDNKGKVRELSKGMMEKLKLSLILSRKAKLYILDEPLGGVDPTTREKILDALIDNFSEESSMIITTHLVNDIERIFDDVAFISNGKIILSGNAEELRIAKNKSIDELYREVFK